MKSEDLVVLVTEALDELKAFDVQVLDVRSLTDVTDFMIMASGRSGRQVRAIADNVSEKAKAASQAPMGVEGKSEGAWVLIDLCDVVVHVMVPDARDFYQLEKLWSGAEAVQAPSPSGASA